MSLFRLGTLVFLLSMSGLLHAAISSQIDKQVISQGETFRLLLSITKNDASQVDLSPLDDNFEVVSRSHQSSTRIINGSIESSTKLVLTLAPKKAGILSIPVLNLAGEKSEPLQIEVKKVEQPSAVDGGIELLSTLSDESPRVHQPVIYEMNLVLGQRIFNAAFQEPQVKQGKALIEALGEQKQYRQTLNGREMLVVEQSWMITPQQSGVLEIEGAQLSAEVANAKAVRDPYRRYNGSRSMRRIFVAADSYTLDVASIPAEFAGKQWITASELSLRSQLSADEWKQGEPVTRTITLQAKGMSEAQLPTISLPEVAGLKQYAAKPLQEQLYTDNKLGVRMEMELTLIPSKAGVLVLPEYRLPWWDTKSNSQKIAVIPEQTVNVKPIAGANLVAPDQPAESSTDTDSRSLSANKALHSLPDDVNIGEGVIAEKPNRSDGISVLQLVLACLASVLLGGFATAFIYRNKGARISVTRNLATVQKQPSFSLSKLRTACNENDAKSARVALLAWLNHFDPSITNLNNLSEDLPDVLIDAVTELNRSCFSASRTKWDGSELLKIVLDLRATKKTGTDKTEHLKPLFN